MRSSPLHDSLNEHAMVSGGARPSFWPSVLIVDSDSEMLRTLVLYFEMRRFHVAACSCLNDAKTFIHRHKTWTLVISDYHLPDGTGLDLCCWIRDQLRVAPPFLLLSGSVNCAALCGEVDFLAKPFPMKALESRVRTLLGS